MNFYCFLIPFQPKKFYSEDTFICVWRQWPCIHRKTTPYLGLSKCEGVVWGQTLLFGAGYSVSYLQYYFRGLFAVIGLTLSFTGISVAFKEKACQKMSGSLALEADL